MVGARRRREASSPPPRRVPRRDAPRPVIEDGDVVAITPAGAALVAATGERRARHDRGRLGRRERPRSRLRDVHAQGDLRAARGGARDDRRPRPPRQLVLESLGLDETELRNLRRIVIVACGTAYHAGVVGRYVLEEWARIPVEPDIASEWIYRNPVLSKDTLVIGISQSGETRDTVNAMKLARETRREHARDHEPDGHADHARGRRGPLHALRPRGRRRRVEDVHGAGRAALPGRAQARAGAEDAAAATRSSSSSTSSTSCREKIAGVPRRRPPGRGDRAALLRQAVLPLPRPPHRAAGGARGRAQAEGDLVHPDRRLLGRRDEARPDRAARGGHAGRGRRDRPQGSTTRSSRTSRRPAPAAPM